MSNTNPSPLPNGKDDSSWTSLDLDRLSVPELTFAEGLDERIIGQESGKIMARAAYRAFLNPLRDTTRPVYIALLLGPSRTGKTFTAQAMAELLHGDRDALIRIDCSTYKDDGQITQLIGSGPMWVGYKDPGKTLSDDEYDYSSALSQHNLTLSRKGSENELTIILLDEFEESCDEFMTFFLGIFDSAQVTLGNNSKVDFSNCIFILTSNLAAARIDQLMREMPGRRPMKQVDLGDIERLSQAMIGDRQASRVIEESRELVKHKIDTIVDDVLTRRYPPKFRNRLDEIVVYAPLSREEIRAVIVRELKLIQDSLEARLPANKHFSVTVDPEAVEFLLTESGKQEGGVASLKKVINRYVVAPLGGGLLSDAIGSRDTIRVSHLPGQDKLSFYRLRSTPVASSKEIEKADTLIKEAAQALSADEFARCEHLANEARSLLKSAKDSESVRLSAACYLLGRSYYLRDRTDADAEIAYRQALSSRATVTSQADFESWPSLPCIYQALISSCYYQRKPREVEAFCLQAIEAIDRWYRSGDAMNHDIAALLDWIVYSRFQMSREAPDFSSLFQWVLELDSKHRGTPAHS